MRRQLYGLISLVLYFIMISIPVMLELVINNFLINQLEFDVLGQYSWVSPFIWIPLFVLSFLLLINPLERAIFLAT